MTAALAQLPPTLRRRTRAPVVRLAHLARPDRAQTAAFIARTYHHHYQANVAPHLMPSLLGLVDGDTQLVAAFGLRRYRGDGLIARYLGRPLSTWLPNTATAGAPLELGNLAGDRPGALRALVRALAPPLAAEGELWLLCTATRQLRNGLSHAGTVWQPLAPATRSVLPPEQQSDWGHYFDHDPMVIAIDIPASCRQLGALPEMADPAAVATLRSIAGAQA